MKDAPWIGLCKEEAFGRFNGEVIGHCAHCEETLYDCDDYTYEDSELYCKECYKNLFIKETI